MQVYSDIYTLRLTDGPELTQVHCVPCINGQRVGIILRSTDKTVVSAPGKAESLIRYTFIIWVILCTVGDRNG